jgi:hypothetical protein
MTIIQQCTYLFAAEQGLEKKVFESAESSSVDQIALCSTADLEFGRKTWSFSMIHDNYSSLSAFV